MYTWKSYIIKWWKVIMSDLEKEKKQHGGYRPGAGRKTKYEKTVVMRVPEKYRDTIKALIEHLDETAMINTDYPAAESEPVFLRSLQDRKQEISFKTTPRK